MKKITTNSIAHIEFRIFTGIVVLLFLYGCASAPHRQYRQRSRSPAQVSQKLNAEAKNWMGTPHRMGGLSKKGIDCSGLVMKIYKSAFNISLPRSTELQDDVGRLVKKTALLPGDLLFFKTGFKKRHVGIYLGDKKFVHTSASKGVMISKLDNPYWQDAYRKARRVL